MSGGGNGDRTEARREIRVTRRRLRQRRLATGVVVLLALLLFLMANYVGSRRYTRHDISRSQLFRLTRTTSELLARVDRPVDVYLLMENNHRHYSEIEGLLQEYAVANPKLRLTRVDPNWQKGRAVELIQTHGLEAEAAQVLFVCGERSRAVTMEEVVLSTSRSGEKRGGDQPDRVIEHVANAEPVQRFNGEAAFSSAINEVIRTDRARVRMLQGHGERGLLDYEAGGYAALVRRLEAENMDVEPLVPGTEVGLDPGTCDLLIVAGPRGRIAQPDLDLIDRYLQQHGRLLAMVDSGTSSGIESVLRKWGIEAVDDVVVEPGLRDLDTVPVSVFPDHAITRPLKGMGVLFFRPRSLRPAGDPDEGEGGGPAIDILVVTSDDSWREVDYRAGIERDPERDEPGPTAIAVAVEHGGTEGTALEPTRLVVIGDSSFAGNAQASGGAEALVVAAANWLLDRDYVVAVPSRAMHNLRLDLDARDRQRLMFLVMAGLPACVGMLGLIVWARRRS